MNKFLFGAIVAVMVITPVLALAQSSAPDNSVLNVAKGIEENVPAFISRPILAAIDIIEEWRVTTLERAEVELGQIEAEIKELNTPKAILGGYSKATELFKYLKKGYYNAVIFIFKHPVIFYGIFIVLLFYVLRFIWRMFWRVVNLIF